MESIQFIDLNPPRDHFLEDVIQGLGQKPKRLQPKYFYDLKGSQLFDQICKLDEYYPTRTEMSILDEYSEAIDDLLEPQTALIEFGSGSSIKIRKLLDQSSKIKAYVPMDISKTHLLRAAEQINQSYPALAVTAICADYTQLREFPKINSSQDLTRAVFFPGSTIGNLVRDEANELLSNTSKWIGHDGIMIIGVDLIKDQNTLIQAYDDAKGVTGQFNMNILERINRELEADFNLSAFKHEARFNPDHSRVEMHLVSCSEQTVHIADHVIKFTEGESIHTECSHKFKLEQIQTMAEESGFKLIRTFTDARERFAVCMLKAVH